MKRTLMFAALAAVLISGAGAVSAAGFTYHGSLQDAGKPANGRYDIELTLYSAQTGGSVIGGPLTMYAVPVQGGSFSTEADFGPLAKSFSQAYVGVKVRGAGKGEFATLDTRAAVTVDAATGCPGSWDLLGNAGNPSGSYLGTADTQPLILKTDAAQVVISDLGDGGTVPRWIGGGSQNSSTAGEGAFIGGGGSVSDFRNKNSVGKFGVVTGGADNVALGTATDISGGPTGYATVGGGNHNSASGYAATVAGGGGSIPNGAVTLNTGNSATARGATVGGGQGNKANAVWATVGGGYGNIASGQGSTVSGGGDSQISCGQNHDAPCFNVASGTYATVAGGWGNHAAGNYSFTAGLNNSAGGCYSVAMGNGAVVRDETMSGIHCGDIGTFSWGDSYTGGLTSTGENQFLIAAQGGVGINTSNLSSFAQSTFRIQGADGWTATADTLRLDPPANGTRGTLSSHFQLGATGDILLRSASTSGTVKLQDQGGVVQIGNQASNLGDLHVGSTVQIGNFTTPSSGTILSVAGNAAKPSGGSWAALSDVRLKQNITGIEHPLDRLLALQGAEFEYIPGSHAMEASGRQIGFIAQEVEKVFPDWVGTGDDGYKYVGVHGFEALTVEAVRQLRSEKDAQIEALQVKLDEVLMRLNKLEAGKGQ